MEQSSPDVQPDPPRSGLTRPSRGPWVVLALALLAAGAAVFVWWRHAHAPTPPPAPVAAAPAPSAEPSPAAAPAGVEPAHAQGLLDAISANTLFRRWLGEGEVVHRWAVVTDNLAEGVSPRAQLGFAAPATPFSVVQRGDRTVIAPESYQRYDGFADVVASVDAQAVARAYREMHGVVEAAYRALGYPGASLDRVTARALSRIASTPVREGEVPVVPAGAMFAFADPHLEALPQVEKHLLRMGPRNTRKIQAKAKEILQALELPASAVAGGASR